MNLDELKLQVSQDLKVDDEKLDIDAKVIRDVREDYVCALSEPRTPDFNWQIIETILNEI